MYNLHTIIKISPRACAPSPCFKPEGDRIRFSIPLPLLLFFLPFISVQSSIFPFLATNKLASYLMPIPWSILPSVSPLPFPILPFLLPYCDIWVVSSCCVCHTCVCMRHTSRRDIVAVAGQPMYCTPLKHLCGLTEEGLSLYLRGCGIVKFQLCFNLKVHKNENFFWLRFWILYYFIVGSAKILRFCEKKILIGPLTREIVPLSLHI